MQRRREAAKAATATNPADSNRVGKTNPNVARSKPADSNRVGKASPPLKKVPVNSKEKKGSKIEEEETTKAMRQRPQLFITAPVRRCRAAACRLAGS